MLDYIIVGQGIAGSMLSWFLLKEKQQFLLIDELNPSSSSYIASGLTKPITGPRFVKTWMADELIPFAGKTYRELESALNEPFFHPIPIVKLFDSIKAQNDWSARCAQSEYAAFLPNEQIVYLDKEKVKNNFGGFEMEGSSYLDCSKFLSAYRNYLSSNNLLLNEKFDFKELKIHSDSVSYRNHKAQKIIFCEGASALHNPFFQSLPFQLAKGECLLLEINDFYSDRVINGEILLKPTPNKNEYYAGATHQWHFADDKPSEWGKEDLLKQLSSFLRAPYKVKAHLAAVRPTVKDRRPYLGFHSENGAVGIFNGMGTKGISLAPYFANHFVEHLVYARPLLEEVDIKRFWA